MTTKLSLIFMFIVFAVSFIFGYESASTNTMPIEEVKEMLSCIMQCDSALSNQVSMKTCITMCR